MEQAIKFSQLYWYMVTFMAEKQIYDASIVIEIPLEKGHFYYRLSIHIQLYLVG